jgi:hypothetical protein
MQLGEIYPPVRNTYTALVYRIAAASDRFCAFYNDSLAVCLEETRASALIVDFTWKNGRKRLT